MSNSIITVVGNLTRDAEPREFATGNVTKFRVATNERMKKGTEWVDGEATYVDVAAWRKLGNAAAELRKGQKVIVTGKLKGNAFTRADGTKGYAYEVDASDIGLALVATDAPAKVKAVVEPDSDSPWE